MSLIEKLESPKLVQGAWNTAGVLGGICLALWATNEVESKIMNPDRPAEIIERINPTEGKGNYYGLVLRQCGFSLAAPEVDENGCYTETFYVTSASYKEYAGDRQVKPGKLEPTG